MEKNEVKALWRTEIRADELSGETLKTPWAVWTIISRRWPRIRESPPFNTFDYEKDEAAHRIPGKGRGLS